MIHSPGCPQTATRYSVNSIVTPTATSGPARWRALRTELGALLAVALPILGAQLAQTGMGFVDTVMAGAVSPADLAAVAIGSSLWVPLYLFVSGVVHGATPHVAQLFGAGNTARIGPLVQQSAWLAVATGCLGFVLLRSLDPVLAFMQIDPELRAQVRLYLAGVSWGFPAIALFQALRSYAEGISLTRPIMVVSLLALAINIPLNFVFIHGHLGLPALGGAGCGWATGCIMWLMLVSLFTWLRRQPRHRATGLFARPRPPETRVLKQLFRTGFPIGCAIFVEVSIFAVIALLIGGLGTQTIAAHQIALNFASLAFMVPLSIGLALTVRTGQALGAGAPEQARLTAWAGTGLNGLLAGALASLMILAPEAIARLYTADATVIAQAVALLFLAALFQFSDALQVSFACILRGHKDTVVPMLVTLLAYWGISLPLGYTLGLTDQLGPARGAPGLWIGLLVGLTLAACLYGLRLWIIDRRAG